MKIAFVGEESGEDTAGHNHSRKRQLLMWNSSVGSSANRPGWAAIEHPSCTGADISEGIPMFLRFCAGIWKTL